MSVGRFLQQGAAGNAGGATYVDDVFSTYLYTGTQSAMNITNGIDLDGEGGLVWIKRRGTLDGSHYLWDTERGSTKRLSTNTTNAELSTDSSWISSFNSDGFSIGTASSINNNSYDEASWTFRKQPGFFDVVTYTGDGVAGREIAHNLGSAPGMMIVKSTSDASGWAVYHRSLGATEAIRLDSTGASFTASNYWNDTEPTDSVFTLGTAQNANGIGFVAYLFAHDAQDFGTDSDESIIKCGSYTTNASAEAIVDLGFEPQWVLFKKTNSNGNWVILDNMRGWAMGDGRTGPSNDAMLFPNASFAENVQAAGEITPTGFRVELNANIANGGDTYAYVAIRRPHKPASEFAATDLFGMDTWSAASGATPQFTSGFPVDMAFWRDKDNAGAGYTVDRLRGTKYLEMSSTAAEATSSIYKFDYMTGYGSSTSTYSTIQSWMFRRAPGFFDVVAYTGNSTVRTINHNLGVTPKLAISKSRDDATNWWVYAEFLGDTNYLRLNLTSAVGSAGSNYLWGSTWTDTLFSVGAYSGINFSGYDYICYLFGDVSGISKVGSYTGTGANVDVDCGFTSGARFVLVKRTDSTGDWYLWDSVRGIVAGNDPYLFLNSTAAQVTLTDYIDPLSSGFTITSSAPAALNASGGTYLFLAIA